MYKLLFRPTAIILAAIIVTGVICGAIIYKNNINDNIKNKNDTDKNSGATDNALPSVDVGKDYERPLCVLIVGRDKVSGLADVMMLASFDKNAKSAFVLQIPRDTYAEYGSSYVKINGALKFLGEEATCAFLEDAMGIEIDGYISLELEGFRELVDTMGGVEMNVEKRLKYSDPEQGLYIDLPAGQQTLDGKQAEMLVRYRSGYARGDLDRLDTQKRFLAAFFLSLKQKITPFNIYSIASSVLPYLKTDIPATELVSIGLNAVSIKSEDIRIATLAGEDAVSTISGGSFYVLSASSASEILTQYFGAQDNEFDKNGYFLHPSLENFQKIYHKKIENQVFSADELK